MRSLTRLLRVAPGPGHARAAEQAPGLQTGVGAKAGAPDVVCGSDGTRAGLTFGAVGEGAPLLAPRSESAWVTDDACAVTAHLIHTWPL